MKKIMCLILILSTCFFGGCFNYNDIDKVIFATCVLVDTDQSGNPIIYVEGFKSDREVSPDAGSNQRLLFKGTGKTIFEVLRDIDMSSGYKVNYTNTKSILFTEKAASSNLYDFIDFFSRDQELLIRSYIAVFHGDPEKFMNISFKSQEFIGMYIYNLASNFSPSSRTIITTVNDFLNAVYSKSKTYVITMVHVKTESKEPKIELANGAIIKGSKMIDILSDQDGLGYNFLIDNIKGGSLEVTNPNSPDKYAALEILKSRTTTHIDYSGKNIKLKKIINIKLSLAEAQNCINLNRKTIEVLQNEAENNIKFYCMDLFNKYKIKNIDIFNIKNDIYKKYPKINIQDPIKQTSLDIEVNAKIEGSSIQTNFR